MKKIAIQLERHDEGDAQPRKRERVFVLLDADGGIVAVAGPERVISALTGGDQCAMAFDAVGCEEDQIAVGPVFRVSDEAMKMFLRSWGPDSREGILRQARKLCDVYGTALSTEATHKRFDKAGDRDLAAALWILSVDGESKSVGVYAGSGTRDALGDPTNEACQIGAFVLYLDGEGAVSFDEFQTVAAAARHASEIEERLRPGEEITSHRLHSHDCDDAQVEQP